MSERSHRLTIYLAKDKRLSDDEVIKNIDELSSEAIKLDGAESSKLYIRKPEPHPPSWAHLFTDYVHKDVIGLSSSTGAVLIINLASAKFLITFGLGRHSIQDSKIERDFGLKVALNSIGEDKLRSIDKASHERTPLNSRTQASKGVDIFELALNTEIDLLTAITGSSKVKQFGAQVTGRDALTLNLKSKLNNFVSVLQEAHDYFEKEDYKKSFGWVDNFRAVKDIVLTEFLDEQLLPVLRKQSGKNICWLAEPEIIDWEASAYYVLEKKGKSTSYYPELRLRKLIDVLESKEKNFSIAAVKNHNITVVDDNFNPLKTWSAFNCIYAEVYYKEDLYILQNGNWYKVETDFVSTVQKSIDLIPEYAHALPNYDHNGEGDYNEFVSRDNDYILMDKKNIVHGGGRSSIEYCDLIRGNHDLIHVKRGTGSSNLSHLFAQGEVSAELLSTDAKFRSLLNDKLPKEHRLPNIQERPDTRKYTIVYAIVSEKTGKLELPFFSKVRLKNAHKHLKMLGYNVAICKIDVAEEYKLKAKAKPAN